MTSISKIINPLLPSILIIQRFLSAKQLSSQGTSGENVFQEKYLKNKKMPKEAMNKHVSIHLLPQRPRPLIFQQKIDRSNPSERDIKVLMPRRHIFLNQKSN